MTTNPIEATDDKRLERLFDYTKWHIGIYLGVGSGLVGLLGSKDDSVFVRGLIREPTLMLVAVITMAVAGLAGGVVASAATRTNSFEALWDHRQPIYGIKTFSGRIWASIEHTMFWVSIVLFASSILWDRAI